jgi:peptidyl-tRNA hydrolase
MPETMNRKVLFPLLAITLAACSAKPQNASDAGAICKAISDTGLARQCEAGNATVAVVIDSDDDEAGRETCGKISARVSHAAAKLKGSWQLEIFSPYRSDKQIASCPLHR